MARNRNDDITAPVLNRIAQLRAAAGRVLRRLWPRSVPGRVAVVVAGVSFFLLSTPLLLISFFAANSLAGSLWGAVNIFNSPSVPPPDAEMVGLYRLEPSSTKDLGDLAPAQIEPSSIELRADHTAELENVYEYLDSSSAGKPACLRKITGTGVWQTQTFTGLQVAVKLDSTTAIQGGTSCPSDSGLSYAILGRGKTHALWSYISDPDSDTGLKYAR